MNGGKQPLGYTIIEVLIVLAVSGMMFVIAATFISGKQAKTSFTSGVNELAARLQGTIEEVQDGQYSDIPLDCTFDGTATHPNAGTNGQGVNPQCVFLGKIMHFSEVGAWPAADNATHYEVFSVAGGRVDSTGKAITTLAGAKTEVIPSLTVQQTTPQSIRVESITVDGVPGIGPSFGVSLMQGQGTLDGASLENGVPTVSLYFVHALHELDTTSAATARISGGVNLHPAQTMNICVTNGTESAYIILGSNQNRLAVNVKRNGTAPCV